MSNAITLHQAETGTELRDLIEERGGHMEPLCR